MLSARNVKGLEYQEEVEEEKSWQRVPVVVHYVESDGQELIALETRDEKEAVIRRILESNSANVEFLDLIHRKRPSLITTPGKDTSYEIKVERTVKAYANNKRKGLVEPNAESDWEVYIDTRKLRICALWQIK